VFVPREAPEEDQKRLIAGPGVYICDECIHRVQIISEELD
jgi:ATP-dependent protease Clp ATPase subunit